MTMRASQAYRAFCLFPMICCALLLGGAVPARASIIWNFAWNGTYDAGGSTTASGQIVTNDTPDGNGFFLVTAMNGVWNGFPISGVAPYFTFFNDNLLSLGSPQLTNQGIAFSVIGSPGDDGAGHVSLYFKVGEGRYAESGPNGEIIAGGTFTATPVPEPASLAVIAGGLLGLAVARRRAAA